MTCRRDCSAEQYLSPTEGQQRLIYWTRRECSIPLQGSKWSERWIASSSSVHYTQRKPWYTIMWSIFVVSYELNFSAIRNMIKNEKTLCIGKKGPSQQHPDSERRLCRLADKTQSAKFNLVQKSVCFECFLISNFPFLEYPSKCYFSWAYSAFFKAAHLWDRDSALSNFDCCWCARNAKKVDTHNLFRLWSRCTGISISDIQEVS